MRAVLQGKYASEKRNYSFDFASYLSPGETIATATQVVNLYSGIDVVPVVLTPVSINGTVVTINASGGTVGNIYDLVVTGVTALSSSSQTLNLNAFLPILPGQP